LRPLACLVSAFGLIFCGTAAAQLSPANPDTATSVTEATAEPAGTAATGADSGAARLAAQQAELQAAEEAVRKAAEEAAQKAAEEVVRRLAEEAARKAAEAVVRQLAGDAALQAAEEAARTVADEAIRKAQEEADRKAKEEADRRAQEEADRKAAEEAARMAAEEAEAQRARRASEEAARLEAEEAARIAAEKEKLALVSRCMDIAGPPSAEVARSEEDQRAFLRALAEAQDTCRDAAEASPDAGGPLFHLATIAQASGRHRQAVALYQRAADAGIAPALTRLGDYYNFGIRPIREDVDRAVEYYSAAADRGDIAGITTLAMMHRLGRGVPRDPARMVALLRTAADAGYHFAQMRLAETYLTGEGVPGGADRELGIPDPAAAIPYLAALARDGNVEAALKLADLYDQGAEGLPPDPGERYRWVDLVAQTGDPAALAMRAFLIEQGVGTDPDPERAAAGYVAALETGKVDPAAMRGTVNGQVPPWEQETALAFQRILQERGLYNGRLDADIGPGTLAAARRLSE
jgi:TPR repeat protein